MQSVLLHLKYGQLAIFLLYLCVQYSVLGIVVLHPVHGSCQGISPTSWNSSAMAGAPSRMILMRGEFFAAGAHVPSGEYNLFFNFFLAFFWIIVSLALISISPKVKLWILSCRFLSLSTSSGCFSRVASLPSSLRTFVLPWCFVLSLPTLFCLLSSLSLAYCSQWQSTREWVQSKHIMHSPAHFAHWGHIVYWQVAQHIVSGGFKHSHSAYALSFFKQLLQWIPSSRSGAGSSSSPDIIFFWLFFPLRANFIRWWCDGNRKKNCIFFAHFYLVKNTTNKLIATILPCTLRLYNISCSRRVLPRVQYPPQKQASAVWFFFFFSQTWLFRL